MVMRFDVALSHWFIYMYIYMSGFHFYILYEWNVNDGSIAKSKNDSFVPTFLDITQCYDIINGDLEVIRGN